MTTAPVAKQVLLQRLDGLRQKARLTFELDSYTDDAHGLVRAIYLA